MTTTSADELMSDRRLNLLSVVLVLGAITSILDTTIVNVALDQLHTVFHASVADTQWVSSGYLLALAGVIPLTGWAVERFGARTVWMTALALFLAGSVLCGFAWSLPSLIGFRVLQGLGGGMVLPVTVTILTQAAGPARLGRAIAAIALPGQLAPILGPVIGGTIIDSISWHWLFFVNVPICLLALGLAPRFLPAGVRNPSNRIDLPGFALLTPGLIALAYGISEGGAAAGFAALSAWLPITLGALLIGGFVRYSLRTTRSPLIDVRVFRRRSFGLASIITLAGGFSMYAGMFLIPMFYQVARGQTPFATGLLLIPQGLGTITFILLQGRLAAHFPVRLVVAGGVVLSMISVLPFAFAGPSGMSILLLIAQFVRGFGFGAGMLPLMTLAFAGLDRPEVPRASAAFSVIQRVGAPFGVTVIAVLLQSHLSDAGPAIGQIADAFNVTFWWVFAFSAVPLLLAFLLPAPPRSTPEPGKATEATAELMTEV
jgi:EmrB/QacA subfamily drug resistance transporter